MKPNHLVRDGPLSFYRGRGGGGLVFHKKNCSQAVVAETNCLLQGYELKKLSPKQREIFWNTLIFQNFDTNWSRHKSIYQFHLIY